jgi:hypothetical protein
VRDLSDLLRNCIKFFERDETQMKAHYERQMSELSGQLKRYQQSTGDPEAADLVTRQQDALRNTMK